jgi:hypothetical protein
MEDHHFKETGLAIEAWIHLAQDGVIMNLAVKKGSVQKADNFFSS